MSEKQSLFIDLIKVNGLKVYFRFHSLFLNFVCLSSPPRIGTHGGMVKCHGVTNLVSWCPPGVTLLWSPPGVTLQTNWLKSRIASSLHSHVSQIVQFVIHLNCVRISISQRNFPEHLPTNVFFIFPFYFHQHFVYFPFAWCASWLFCFPTIRVFFLLLPPRFWPVQILPEVEFLSNF